MIVLNFFETIEERLLAERMHVTPDMTPTAAIADTRKILRRYLMPAAIESKFNVKSIIEFYHNYKAGNMKPILKSQSEDFYMESQNKVKDLVGTNFHKYVFDNDDDVFVIFYATWCVKSSIQINIVERIAMELEHVKTLRFYKIEMTHNEVEDEYIRPRGEFPIFKLYSMKNEKKFSYSFDDLGFFKKNYNGIKMFLQEYALSNLDQDVR